MCAADLGFNSRLAGRLGAKDAASSAANASGVEAAVVSIIRLEGGARGAEGKEDWALTTSTRIMGPW